jgi:hypothetical protein
MKPVLPMLFATFVAFTTTDAGEVRFNRDIRPILSENCFACHGPDAKARKADMRLDISGADWEEVVARISSSDPDEQMPPPDSHKKPLAAGQITMLRQWIAEGAKYQKHWAFEPLPRMGAFQAPLAVKNRRSLNDIDVLVGAKLKKHGLNFAPEADPHTLIRRLSFDLTGLPPTESDLSDLSDWSDEKYEALVDRLLASKHFGEHLAVGWLDAARYADTNGYFGDKPRQMWLWRDWVIDAFNREHAL